MSIVRENLDFHAKYFRQTDQKSILPAQIIFFNKNFVVNKKWEKCHGEMSKSIVTNKDIQGRPFWHFWKFLDSMIFA